jgi:S1-C subfamily serine protease
VITYLAEREDAMNFQGDDAPEKTSSDSSTRNRKASTGSVPDFAHQGDGVKIGSVIPGSAGEKAGLQAGDIIVQMNDVKLSGLRQYSDLLKKHQPGDVVSLVIDRDGTEKTIKLELDAR